MKKLKLNLVIDGLLLLCLAAIAGIGFLIKYTLLPGYKRWEIYGRNVDLSFWGLDRHECGTIHLVIGFWGVIVSVYRALIPNTVLRYIVVVVLVCLTILLFAFPFLVKPDVQERGFDWSNGSSWHEIPPLTMEGR
jgi:hypothetical protein